MLTIRHLCKTYPDGTRALREIHLDIPHGMFGLLGPNGAGKSTLMRSIAGLQRPDTGSIHLEGIDLLAQPQQARRMLGYLPQEFGVYPRMSAVTMLEHLAILKGVVRRGERRDLVDSLLQQVNLWAVRHRRLDGFSSGMRQRLGVAQALIGQPRLIIADEPTAGLDPAERNRFLNLLASISEQVIVLMSTHIVQDVTDLCPQMAIIAQGEVLLSGRPRDAIAQLQGRVWRRQVPKAQLDAYRARLTILSTRLIAGQPLLHVLAEQAPDEGFEPVQPSLEDVYFGRLSPLGAGGPAED